MVVRLQDCARPVPASALHTNGSTVSLDLHGGPHARCQRCPGYLCSMRIFSLLSPLLLNVFNFLPPFWWLGALCHHCVSGCVLQMPNPYPNRGSFRASSDEILRTPGSFELLTLYKEALTIEKKTRAILQIVTSGPIRRCVLLATACGLDLPLFARPSVILLC